MEDKLNGNKRKNQYSKENLNKKLEIYTENEKNKSDIKENNDLNLKEVKISKKEKNKNNEIDDEEIFSEADNEKELEFQELLRRNLQRLVQTGKYVPAKGIWESTERVERLVRTAMGSLDKDAIRRDATDHDETAIPIHSKFDFDKKLAEMANYELLENRKVRHVPPQGQRRR